MGAKPSKNVKPPGRIERVVARAVQDVKRDAEREREAKAADAQRTEQPKDTPR